MSAVAITKQQTLEPESAAASPGSVSDEITLLVCKSFSGEIVRACVRPDRTIDQLIPEIADQIGYSSPNWEKIGLYNLTRDFEYSPEQVLAETRTQSGDLVIMADGAGCHKKE